MGNKDAHYIRHDYNAGSDLKLVKVRRKYGAEGYGIYWLIIEHLRQQKDGKIPMDDLEDFTYNVQVDKAITEDIVGGYDLFIIEDGWLHNARLNRDTEKYNSLKQKRIEAGRSGGLAKAEQNLANSKQLSSSKVKNSKVKNSKVKEENVTASPDICPTVFDSESDEIKFSKELHARIKENNGKAKEPNWNIWAKEFDIMFRNDGHDKQEIADVIIWAQQNDFWKKNIMCPAKLRKQFARLHGEMTNDKNWQKKKTESGQEYAPSGVTDYDGNRIKVKKTYLRGCIVINAYGVWVWETADNQHEQMSHKELLKKYSDTYGESWPQTF